MFAYVPSLHLQKTTLPSPRTYTRQQNHITGPITRSIGSGTLDRKRKKKLMKHESLKMHPDSCHA